jgi:hypothetical protein
MEDIIRIDLCHSDDEDTKSRLLEVIAEMEGRTLDDDGNDGGLGAGVSRFQVGASEVTVYVDAWGVDVAGPEPLVRRLLAAMAGL